MKTFVAITLALSLAALAVKPARAVPIPRGTVVTSFMFSPAVATDVSPGTATYEATNGLTIEIGASGSFSSAAGGSGTLNGFLTFSKTPWQTTYNNVPNFLAFDDFSGGRFNFSVSSVTTLSFTDSPSATTSGSLYLLGDAFNVLLGYDATPASLTLTFNSTGGSAYTSSATLAVPPLLLGVTEPESLLLLGSGLLMAGLIRRKVAARS